MKKNHLALFRATTLLLMPIIILEKPLITHACERNTTSLTEKIYESDIFDVTEEDILEEWRLGDMELVSQIVQAEAGNQDLDGMRLVADCVLNRVDSDEFPDTVSEVIFEAHQFGPTYTGYFDEVAWNMSENAFKAVEMEWDRESRLDPDVLYFNTTPSSGKNCFKHMDHWFGY